ncbi:pyridoxamine 5'-phosphate oxidase family protein [Hydrogenophaga sp.]|uniref:pyridoxamine 5'-phosphate oxidase family protein n=1 Tax=Hydrogenophaga sp. TaxID=1904254 RepID=UPI00272EFC78|nr:pyridoxamine 5'-phosphate oxidase family protein [Hydrogenophaga sp.]MDP2017018.1 pyridoxamine 5'-phosphate oxidase family protein [Hydrogenophaga sp.]MDP3167156.1 pyridoxamine 5'-phosphate oxidase family protein [Hydrogenophaga sp.]
MNAFHAGEQALQARAGVQAQMAQIGPRVMRDHMPDQHREFFGLLPFVVVGSVDAQGQPWASVLAGAPGFMTSPDPTHLHIRARPLPHDPLTTTLHDGAPLGLLGIQPHTRRRNRMNGTAHLRQDGLTVEVGQSFGNCPKYIQAREPVWLPELPAGQLAHQGSGLDETSRELIRAADTFFIATAHPDAAKTGEPCHGVDVSHRGGAPGFVKVEGDRLTVPDFPGNLFFNTLGNIAVHPPAGLLFMDFERGDLLYLAAHASVVWDGAELEAFEGAQRLLRLDVKHALRVQGGLPLRWGPAERSQHLATMGNWSS